MKYTVAFYEVFEEEEAELRKFLPSDRKYFFTSKTIQEEHSLIERAPSKICAVADSFDAMTSARYYNFPKTKYEAIEELKNMSETFYDKNVIDAFLLCKI